MKAFRFCVSQNLVLFWRLHNKKGGFCVFVNYALKVFLT